MRSLCTIRLKTEMEVQIAEYDTEAERKRVFKEILCAAIDNGRIPEI